MAKNNNNFVCQECGSVSTKWSGKCSACGAWDTIIEEKTTNSSYSTIIGKKTTQGKNLEFATLEGDSKPIPRVNSHIKELDRVLGGGIVPGSAVLIGGDPGIGKSTLLLQLASQLSNSGNQTFYISGEESVDQIRLRAKRLEVDKAPVNLLCATSVKDIIKSIATDKSNNKVVIIDSIQTMFVEEITSAPGTISQVRAAAYDIINYCKSNNTTVFFVGHVNKEGQIAGPKVLEHMVDTVLYFEGERGHHFRILRAVKNRFGAANEIGVFEMVGEGLQEVNNPSALFISNRDENVSGSVVFAGIEGSRPVLVEVQALVSPSLIPTPRRAVVGWDANRLAMIIAVLGVRYGINLSDKEVYLNIAGGLKINEPAADLAVALALISAYTDIALPNDCIVFGEIGLSGEIRMVSQADIRIKEAEKLGFNRAILPSGIKYQNNSFNIMPIQHITAMRKIFDNSKIEA